MHKHSLVPPLFTLHCACGQTIEAFVPSIRHLNVTANVTVTCPKCNHDHKFSIVTAAEDDA